MDGSSCGNAPASTPYFASSRAVASNAAASASRSESLHNSDADGKKECFPSEKRPAPPTPRSRSREELRLRVRAGGPCSRSRQRPSRASSAAAESPAGPAPTTIASNVCATPSSYDARVEPVTGSFEIHIFVEPFDPSDAVTEKFRAACASAAAPMKALLLRLDYAGKGFVGVLQSSRYVQGTPETAREAAALDAEILRRAGFTVIREKVEAIAANAGVPRTMAEGKLSLSDRYFEFHVLIDGRTFPLSEDDMLALRRISAQFSEKLGQPVPLSYNALKPAQRF